MEKHPIDVRKHKMTRKLYFLIRKLNAPSGMIRAFTAWNYCKNLAFCCTLETFEKILLEAEAE